MLLVSVANAADTGWIAMDDGVGPQDVANWNDPNNWSLTALPTAGDKVKFYSGTAECRITGPVVGGQLVMGDNGGAVAPEENFIHIMPGGTLTTGTSGSWAAIGYNHPAKMVIEKGGTWDNGGSHFWLGMNSGSGGSILDINGGTMKNNNNALQLGRNGGGIDVYLNAGLIDVVRFAGDLIDTADTSGSSLDIKFGIDIKFGTFKVHRTNLTASIESQIAAGLITAFGEQGDDGIGAELVVTVGGGVTTITATDPMEADPAYGQDQVYYENVDLGWYNMEPNNPATALVNVWFGQLEEGATEPNKLGPLYNLVLENEPWTEEWMSVRVGEDDGSGTYFTGVGEYYWQVEIVDIGIPNINSPLYYFSTTDNLPPWDVSAGADQITWAGESIDLLGSYGDEGTPTVLWESSDPNTVFSPSDDGGVTGG